MTKTSKIENDPADGQPLPALLCAEPDSNCPLCPRLHGFREAVRAREPDWFNSPVPSFGDPDAQLLIVGLAPGLHGANRTGRPFTGDYAGILLYGTLYDFGFATHPESLGAGDDLRLVGARITNAVKCLPPGNKPLPAEIRECNAYLAAELSAVPDGAAILALGRIAHDAALRALDVPARGHGFAHGARHALERGVCLFDCYHCSRYNTNTKRLTPAMFTRVFRTIARHLEQSAAPAA
jgi:uracil-DNA glycosylase family 4